ncbi:MAG: VacJ family lipoprotein [Deltaproteobacteria bacterium]|nr:VacJ family lipoprotein [Deltaproteobacteria bacterium]
MSGDAFDTFDEFEVKEIREKVSDPLMGYNRFMTKFNDKVYFWFFKPVARAYSFVAPEVVRISVSRFFKNLAWPIRGFNNLLQLKFRCAGIETARFAVNTTVGVAGFFDPARSWLNLCPCPEDFGQTLGHYGVGPGIPLVIPFVGPSNIRDAMGLVPDYYLDPVSYIKDWKTAFAVDTYGRFNTVSLHIGEYEKLREGAVDWYIFMRNAYEQNREKAIGE